MQEHISVVLKCNRLKPSRLQSVEYIAEEGVPNIVDLDELNIYPKKQNWLDQAESRQAFVCGVVSARVQAVAGHPGRRF